jgi:hypothetical protein
MLMARERSVWRDWRAMKAHRQERQARVSLPPFQQSYPQVWYPEPQKPRPAPEPKTDAAGGLPKYSPAIAKLQQVPKPAPEPIEDTSVEKMIARALSSFTPEADPTPALHLNATQLIKLAEIEDTSDVRIIEDIDEIDAMLNEELNSPRLPYWRRMGLPLSRHMIEQRRLDLETKRRLGLMETSS